MDRIIARVEQDQGWRAIIEASRPEPDTSAADAIAAAARQVAHTIGAHAIAAFTLSGSTALLIARERPESPILGLTPDPLTARRLAVVWGVHAVVTPDAHSMSEAVAKATRIALSEGFAGTAAIWWWPRACRSGRRARPTRCASSRFAKRGPSDDGLALPRAGHTPTRSHEHSMDLFRRRPDGRWKIIRFTAYEAP